MYALSVPFKSFEKCFFFPFFSPSFPCLSLDGQTFRRLLGIAAELIQQLRENKELLGQLRQQNPRLADAVEAGDTSGVQAELKRATEERAKQEVRVDHYFLFVVLTGLYGASPQTHPLLDRRRSTSG